MENSSNDLAGGGIFSAFQEKVFRPIYNNKLGIEEDPIRYYAREQDKVKRIINNVNTKRNGLNLADVKKCIKALADAHSSMLIYFVRPQYPGDRDPGYLSDMDECLMKLEEYEKKNKDQIESLIPFSTDEEGYDEEEYDDVGRVRRIFSNDEADASKEKYIEYIVYPGDSNFPDLKSISTVRKLVGFRMMRIDDIFDLLKTNVFANEYGDKFPITQFNVASSMYKEYWRQSNNRILHGMLDGMKIGPRDMQVTFMLDFAKTLMNIWDSRNDDEKGTILRNLKGFLSENQAYKGNGQRIFLYAIKHIVIDFFAKTSNDELLEDIELPKWRSAYNGYVISDMRVTTIEYYIYYQDMGLPGFEKQSDKMDDPSGSENDGGFPPLESDDMDPSGSENDDVLPQLESDDMGPSGSENNDGLAPLKNDNKNPGATFLVTGGRGEDSSYMGLIGIMQGIAITTMCAIIGSASR